MESIIFAVCLFVITLITLCWFVTPVKVVQEETKITNKNETETSDCKSYFDLQSEEATTEDTPVVQEFQEELINEKPTEEIPNNNLEIQQESKEEIPSGIDLKNIRTYLLHKHRCIKIKDLPSNFQLPQDIKTYNLRGEQVVRLSALEALIAT